MVITLERNSSGFVVKAGEGKSAHAICHADFKFFQEALNFAVSEAKRRGWSLVNRVEAV